MRIVVLTLFPEIVEGYFSQSIMSRAVQRGIISYTVVNFRDYATDRHSTVDDLPYGGGAGMVLKCEPLARALDDLPPTARVLCPTPSGALFTQQKAADLAREEELVFICGRYEGIDQRVIDEYVDDELSVGDYVLSSGEIASLAIIDAVYRLLDGVINCESLAVESHSNGVLEYPQYTRPEHFRGRKVPAVLLSGHHKNIQSWRRKESLRRTLAIRPDILEHCKLTGEDENFLTRIKMEDTDGSD